jgi:hypothetical protein
VALTRMHPLQAGQCLGGKLVGAPLALYFFFKSCFLLFGLSLLSARGIQDLIQERAQVVALTHMQHLQAGQSQAVPSGFAGLRCQYRRQQSQAIPPGFGRPP